LRTTAAPSSCPNAAYGRTCVLRARGLPAASLGVLRGGRGLLGPRATSRDPQEHVQSLPGVGEVLGPALLAGLPDPNRFPGRKAFPAYMPARIMPCPKACGSRALTAKGSRENVRVGPATQLPVGGPRIEPTTNRTPRTLTST